jgi:hypothetical protein
MVGMAKDVCPIPANDVVDWMGKDGVWIDMYTGTSTIKPGMLVYGSTHVAQNWSGSGNVVGYALYKESAPSSQKSDWSSAYAKGKWIAVVPLGTPCRIYGFTGTITATQPGALLKPDSSTAGAVSPMALVWSGSNVIQAKIVARALVANTTGAGGRAMIEVV